MAEENLNNNPNINITPDMINNLVNMLKSKNFTDGNSSSNNEPSTSTYQSSSSNDVPFSTISTSSNSTGFENIDFDTVLKIKSIMETLNKKDDPRSNLLYSLKPYLRETRQKKLDQYVNLFKITEVTNLFKNDKGDGN